MADWYVSSAAWNALPQWAPNTAYTVGQIVRPLTTPGIGYYHSFRVSVAGTSAATEPNWQSNQGNNNSFTNGTVTFVNVTGQAAYGWSAPAGMLWSLSNFGSSMRGNVGDRFFLSSDHSESNNSTNSWQIANTAFGVVQVLSVNRAGSVPPVAADLQNGAQIISTSTQVILENATNMYWQGITFTFNGIVYFANSNYKGHYFKNCSFIMTASASRIGSANSVRVVWDNVTIQFNAAAQYIGTQYPFELMWMNTPNAIQGSVLPTVLFQVAAASNGPMPITCRGVDLSALTTNLMTGNPPTNYGCKVLLDSCRIAPGVTRIAGTGGNSSVMDELELVNCFDGSSILSERHTQAGDLTTSKTVTMTGGAQDDGGAFSHMMISSVRSDSWTFPLDSFWMDIENQAIGAAHTATVEIISSVALTNNDISMMIEYEGTSGSSVAAFASTQMIPGSTPVALPSSTAIWNNPPATPQAQRLQVTFTPQTAGRVRGQIRLGRTSTTVYVNPQLTIT